MDWFSPIDVYCERTGPEFWSEPVNAVTNAAFVIAAMALWPAVRRWERERRGGKADGVLRVLVVMVGLIGVCSFSFHTFAVGLTGLLDVASIALFLLSFLAVYVMRVGGAKWWGGLVAVLGLIAATAGCGMLVSVSGVEGKVAGYLGRVAAYGPSGAMAFVLGAWARRRGVDGAGWLFMAGGVFVLSMAAAILDGELCEVTPFGTHFLWHIFNGVVLYAAMRGLVAGMWWRSAREGDGGSA